MQHGHFAAELRQRFGSAITDLRDDVDGSINTNTEDVFKQSV